MTKQTDVWYWLALAVLCITLAAYVRHRDLLGDYAAHEESVRLVEDRQRDLGRLRQREEALQERVDGLGDDPVEMEAAIRRSKNLIREGERIYRIPLDGDYLDTVGAADRESDKDR